MVNTLEKGMVFKDSCEAARFLGFDDTGHHSNLNLQRLSHFCEFHRDENKKVYIDKVFDEPIPFKRKDFKYKVGEIINVSSGSFKILECYRDKSPYKNHLSRYCKCQCEKDGYVFEILEHRIDMGVGCPICGNKKVIPGIRSLYDNCPDALKYLANPEEAKNLAPSASKKKLLCKCPDCGYTKMMSVNNLTRHGFSCDYCSDGISYPNKFMRNMLLQLGVEFIPEYMPNWSDGKRYDQYLPLYKLIIENHGLQHYRDTYFNTYKNTHKNDVEKKNSALNNGVEQYIEIDCRVSDKEYIKTSIMNSCLPQLLGFIEDDIDWDKCDIVASKSNMVQVWDYWNNGYGVYDIVDILNIDRTTVQHYIQKGFDCGKCERLYYETQGHKEKRYKQLMQYRMKPIYCVEDNLYFSYCKEAENYYKSCGESFYGKGLYQYIGSNRLYKGRTFIYVTRSEFNNMMDISPDIVFGERFTEECIKEELKYA